MKRLLRILALLTCSGIVSAALSLAIMPSRAKAAESDSVCHLLFSRGGAGTVWTNEPVDMAQELQKMSQDWTCAAGDVVSAFLRAKLYSAQAEVFVRHVCDLRYPIQRKVNFEGSVLVTCIYVGHVRRSR
jgi:hypothetical protein